jgi:hypothetical protein
MGARIFGTANGRFYFGESANFKHTIATVSGLLDRKIKGAPPAVAFTVPFDRVISAGHEFPPKSGQIHRNEQQMVVDHLKNEFAAHGAEPVTAYWTTREKGTVHEFSSVTLKFHIADHAAAERAIRCMYDLPKPSNEEPAKLVITNVEPTANPARPERKLGVIMGSNRPGYSC